MLTTTTAVSCWSHPLCDGNHVSHCRIGLWDGSHVSHDCTCQLHVSGQIIIFHQPRFPWNFRGFTFQNATFLGANRSCEVIIIWHGLGMTWGNVWLHSYLWALKVVRQLSIQNPNLLCCTPEVELASSPAKSVPETSRRFEPIWLDFQSFFQVPAVEKPLEVYSFSVEKSNRFSDKTTWHHFKKIKVAKKLDVNYSIKICWNNLGKIQFDNLLNLPKLKTFPLFSSKLNLFLQPNHWVWATQAAMPKLPRVTSGLRHNTI